MKMVILSFAMAALLGAASQQTMTALLASSSPTGGTKTPVTDFRPRQTLSDCANCPEMVVVPPGSFTMGSPSDEQWRNDIEGPQRLVNIRRFAVGKFDVTRGQWATFASATNRATIGGCIWAPSNDKFDPKISWRKLGFAQNDDHPVVCVTWQDAQDYVHWLGQRTGHKYRLLSEAEWEYAARGGTTTAYPWGSSATHEYANYGAANAARESPLDATGGCRPHLSARSRRMRSVFTTCTAMSCNGYRIVSQLLIQEHLQMVPLTKRRFS